MAKLSPSAITESAEGSSVRTTEAQWLDQSDSTNPSAQPKGVSPVLTSPSATNNYTPQAQTIIAWNMRSLFRFILSASANFIIINPPDILPGFFTLHFTNPATGGFAPSWGSAFVWPGDAEPQFNTAPGAVNIYLAYSDGTNIYMSPFYQTPLIS